MQSNTKQHQQVNIKVERDGEMRRFTLAELNFPFLEKQIRALFLTEPTAVLKIIFLDDDKDWVTIETTSELQHACELEPNLLRLRVERSAPTVTSLESSEGNEEETGRHPGRGRHQGRGIGQGRGRGMRRDTQENFQPHDKTYNRQQHLAQKLNRVTAHIGEIETMLSVGDVPEGQRRTLNWRLLRLKNKVDMVQRKKAALEEIGNLATPTPSSTLPEISTPTPTPSSPNSDDFLAAKKAFQEARKNLWTARRGDGLGHGRRGCRARAPMAFSPETELLHSNLVQAKEELKLTRQHKRHGCGYGCGRPRGGH